MGNGNGNDVSKFTKWVKLAAVLVGLLMAIGGVMWGVETRYAKADDITIMTQAIAGNAKGIQVIRLEKQVERIRDRIWALEDRFGLDCKECPTKYRREYDQRNLDIESIKRRIKKLES